MDIIDAHTSLTFAFIDFELLRIYVTFLGHITA